MTYDMLSISEMSNFENECDYLLKRCSPTEVSEIHRNDISNFVVKVIQRKLATVDLYEVGSSSLKTYLPESDLDLVLITSENDSSAIQNIYCDIFNALCNEISLKDDGDSEYKSLTIRNIEFINARTKIAHCVVNNVAVDISVNQVSSLATVTFLEEADRCIGKDHLLKRSIMLVKVRIPKQKNITFFLFHLQLYISFIK